MVEAACARDRLRRRRIVAGDHDHADAGRAALRDRAGTLGAQRIGKADQAGPREGEAAAAVPAASPVALARATASTRSPSRASASTRCRSDCRAPRRAGTGATIASGAPLCGDRSDAARRPRATHASPPGDRAQAVLRTSEVAALRACRRLRAIARSIGSKPSGALARAAPSCEQPAPLLTPCGAQRFGHRHAVLGERAGLVDAQARWRQPRSRSRGAPRQHARARDPPRAHRHEDRQHQRKLLGQHRHAERDAAKRASSHAAAQQAVDRRRRRCSTPDPASAKTRTKRLVSACRRGRRRIDRAPANCRCGRSRRWRRSRGLRATPVPRTTSVPENTYGRSSPPAGTDFSPPNDGRACARQPTRPSAAIRRPQVIGASSSTRRPAHGRPPRHERSPRTTSRPGMRRLAVRGSPARADS